MNHIRNRFSVRKLLSLVLALVMVASMFAGCGKKNDTPTEPSSDPTPSTDAPSSVTTEPTETEPEIDVEGLLNIRSSPTMDGTVIGHLDPNAKVDILREQERNGVRWALIREGWICIEYLEQYYDVTVNGDSDSTEPSTEPEGSASTTAPTTATEATTNNNNNNNTNNNTNTDTSKDPAVVTASELNIRKEASQTSDKVGTYKRGDRITILETKNGWVRTDKGWVSAEYVYKEGTTGKNGCKAVVTGNGINVRQGPGTKYDAVGSASYGDRLIIKERVQIGETWWGYYEKGWICLDYVYIDGTKGDHAGSATVLNDGVNVRSGPGTQFDAVTSVNKGTDIEILFQMEINGKAWGCFSKGWICMDYVGMG